MHVSTTSAVIAIALVAGMATNGSAEPAATEPIAYVQVDVAFGLYDSIGGPGFGAEAGWRLRGTPLWLHGMVVAGTQLDTDPDGDGGDRTGGFFQTRAGLEVRPCALDGVMCGIVGVDLGLQVVDPSEGAARHDLVTVGRIGFDLGHRVRIRPTFERGYGPGGVTSTNLVLGIGYAF